MGSYISVSSGTIQFRAPASIKILLRTFFSSLPNELFNVAQIDGANDFQIYRHVALPLSKGILATLAILRFQQIWNDLIWPLITISTDAKRTITTGLFYFQDGSQTQYGAMFAGYLIVSIPLLLLFAFSMKQFMAGMTAGAIKNERKCHAYKQSLFAAIKC